MRLMLIAICGLVAAACSGGECTCPPVLEAMPPGTYSATETPERFRYEVKLDRVVVEAPDSVAVTFTYLGRTVVQRYRAQYRP